MPVQLRYLTAERTQAAINRMSKKYAPKTVRNAWGLFSAALKSYGLTFDIVLPQRERKEYNVPTEKQVFDLIDAASGNIKTAVILAAFCGLRRGEIVALESTDIKDGQLNLIRIKSETLDNLSYGISVIKLFTVFFDYISGHSCVKGSNHITVILFHFVPPFFAWGRACRPRCVFRCIVIL